MKPYPKHKGTGLPSRMFLYGAFRRHLNQRLSLEFIPPADWKEMLTELGFDLTQPIYFNGIFKGFWKKKDRQLGGPIKVILRFAGCIWKQGDKSMAETWGRTSRHATRGEWQFEISDFKGLKWSFTPLLEGGDQIR